MSDDPHQLAVEIKAKAVTLGFDLVGITDAGPSRHAEYFERWLAQGRAGAMKYLERRVHERTDPSRYLPGARSVICVAMNYHRPLDQTPPAEPSGRVARYALGDDYHDVIKPRLYELADWLRARVPGAATRCGVDTVPVLERELAARAGIGWIGKNTCVIHPRIGSWLFLGEVLTTLALATDEPETDHCGNCRRCIDACPTGAIDEPYQLDPRRCISYLTIENSAAADESLASQVAPWLYGCDICQEVCPYNRSPPTNIEPRLQPRLADGQLRLADVLSWRSSVPNTMLRGSAMKRVSLPMFHRNALQLMSQASRPVSTDAGRDKLRE